MVQKKSESQDLKAQAGKMKRRTFSQGMLFSLVYGPAFAADPLPALQETPMFADQLKSGVLPPVNERIPRQPLVVKKFAGGEGPG